MDDVKKIENENENEKKSSEVSGNVDNLIQDTTKQLEEIKTSLQDKATEVDELHSIALEQENKFAEELSKLKEQLEAKESAMKELQQALEQATKDKEEAFTELSNMKEEALVKERLNKLQDLKLLRSSEEAQLKQAEKIRFMSEEEFAEYLEDLDDIRSQASTSGDESAEPAQPVIDEEAAVKAALDSVKGEQAKAKLREILNTLKKDESSEDKKLEEDTAPAEVVEKKEQASISTPNVKQLEQLFMGIIQLKNNKKEG